MQSRCIGCAVSPNERSSLARAVGRWCAALALAAVACALWVPSALAARPGIKPQWTFAQFVLNDRMTLSVNVESGNLNLAARDIDVGGNLGPQADFSRYYNSLNAGTATAVDVGWGWSTNAGPDVKLSGTYGSDMTFYGPTGYQAPFVWSSPGYKLATGIGGQIKHNADNSWEVWMYRQGIKYEFTSLGVLTATKDLSGNTLTNGYTAGLLTSLTSQQGVTDTITETSGQITGASAPPTSAARTWGYARDANGNLHTYTGPDGFVTTYTYAVGSNHLITQIDDPEARRTIIAYDGSGRATSVEQVTNNTTNAGDTTTFAYTPGSITVGGVTYDGKTVVTDPNGHATTYYYASSTGTVGRTDDALGHAHLGTWTANDDPKSSTDALSDATNYRYTDSGTTDCGTITNDFLYNRCKTTSARTINSTASYTDTTNPFLPHELIDGRGVKTDIQYDANVGLVNQVTDALTKNTTFTHNATTGNLTRVTNPKTFQVNYTYRADGSLQYIDDNVFDFLHISYAWDTAFRNICWGRESQGGRSEIDYDDYDRPTYIDFNGDCAKDGAFPHSARTYDKSGNLTALTTYDGSVVPVVIASTTYTYDKKNRLTQEAETAPFAATTTYTYDGADNLKTIVNAGGTTTYNYDAADRLTSIVEPGPNTTTFGYDNADRRTSMTYPNGVAENYTYDADGNVATLVATKGTTTLLDLTYSYCNAYVGTTCTAPTDQRTSVRNRVSSHDAVDSTTNYSYNANGWLTEASTINSTTSAVIKDYKWTYDDNGNRITQQIDGGTVQNVTYYDSGVEDRVKQGGQGTCADTFSHAWSNDNDLGLNSCATWAYNARNQVSASSVPATSNIGYSGDDNNNIVSIGSDNWTNDQLGVSRKISGATSYDYLRDTDGQHLGQRNGTTRYYYVVDALGTVLEVTDATGAIVNDYTYDAWGYPRTATGQTTNEIPFRYTGAQWIPNGSVYHLGARYYDPRYGHFTQPDPDSVYDLPGMGSRYVYANNDPVSNADPTGTDTQNPNFCVFHVFCSNSHETTARLSHVVNERTLSCAALASAAFGEGFEFINILREARASEEAGQSLEGIATQLGRKHKNSPFGVAIAVGIVTGIGGPCIG